jgi:ATP-dependent Clp protease ATP-binding subunit ClpA
MEINEQCAKIVQMAVELADERSDLYVMPEHLLLAMLYNVPFVNCFTALGGDVMKLKRDLDGFLTDIGEKKYDEDDDVIPSADFCAVVDGALERAYSSGRENADVSHLFAALLNLKDSFAVYYLSLQRVDLIELLGVLSRESLSADDARLHAAGMLGEDEREQAVSWRDFVEDMTELCLNANQLIGRERELERTIQILCRMDKNNVIHLGEAGVGKTAIAYGLARMIVNDEVPEPLKGATMYSLDMGAMMAGTQYRGELEKRFKAIMNGLMTEDKPILYIDEVHNIAGTGATSESSFDMSNMLKPYLAQGHIRFIGATTHSEYKKSIGKSRSLVRRFQTITIEEPSKSEAVEILKGLADRYEEFHGVKYDKDVFEYAVEVSSRYMNERFLPDKAIDLIDEAGAYRRLNPDKKNRVNKALIDLVLSKMCNIPPQSVEKSDEKRLAELENVLKSRVFGQDEAITGVANAVKFSRAGLNDENKPIASFLFVGPTGVGKTETAKALADELGVKLIRFDMSEYAEKHTIAKLIGSPAGYIGYEEGGLLTEEIRKTPHAVLLLDEIEKAHSDIYNILLQVMDYATLTDNQGHKADFKNVVVIMTSNAGASEMGKASIGFGGSSFNNGAIDDAVKRTFTPEFRNRLSKIVVFNGMDDEMARLIAGKKLTELAQKLKAKGVELSVTEAAVLALKGKGVTNLYGARELDRVISNDIKPQLAQELLFGKLKKGGKCVLDAKDGEFVFNM